jgi:hypothetical protein
MRKLAVLSAFVFLSVGALTTTQATPAAEFLSEPACTDLNPSCNWSAAGVTYFDCRPHSNGCCAVTYYTVYCDGGGTQTWQRATNYQNKSCVKLTLDPGGPIGEEPPIVSTRLGECR